MTLFAVVPVKDLMGTKSRLVPVLNASGRAGLTIYMMNNVLAVLKGAGVDRACVVSPDRTVLSLAEEAGVEPLLQEGNGLNSALEQAQNWAVERGATSLLVLPADLPLLRTPDVRAVLEAAEEVEGPLAVVCPDASGTGTNALLLRPPDSLPFLFGPSSFDAHLNAARERELQTRTCRRTQLAFDLDTADDLSRLGGAPPGTRAGDEVGTGSEVYQPPGELRVLSVGGIPEVRPGDDLADLIVRAAHLGADRAVVRNHARQGPSCVTRPPRPNAPTGGRRPRASLQAFPRGRTSNPLGGGRHEDIRNRDPDRLRLRSRDLRCPSKETGRHNRSSSRP
jgi:2-phospho-L-lactate guanylyltransferase